METKAAAISTASKKKGEDLSQLQIADIKLPKN